MKSLINKLLATAFLLCLAQVISAQEQSLIVWLKSGQKIHLNLNDMPATRYFEGSLTITTSTMSVTYPLEMVSKYTYELGASEVKKTISDKYVLQNGNVITFFNLSSESKVKVHGSDGKLLKTVKADDNNSVRLDLEDFPDGVYLIKADDTTYKFSKIS